MISKIRLLIADRDREYSEALAAQILLTSGECSVSVSPSATAAELREEDYDYILLDEKSKGEFLNGENQKLRKKCVVLDPKYGSVSELLSHVLLLDAKRTGKRRVLWERKKNGVLLTGFLSGSGGSGKTCAALAFARYLARDMGKRVLYLSLEELNGAAFYLASSEVGKAISENRQSVFLDDFLYYFFSGDPEKREAALCSFFRQDRYGVSILPAGRLRNELLSLPENELVELMETLLLCGCFDEIVLDFSLSFRDEMILLLKSCHSLVLVNTGGEYRLARHQRLQSVLLELGIEQKKLFKFQMEWEREGGAERDAADIYHELGREVKALAERMGRE